MYLSRVELDERRNDTVRALFAPQRMHGAVERAFAGERQRRLWRLDRLHGTLYLLMLSADAPDLRSIAAQFGPIAGGCAQTREYDPLLSRIEAGGGWQFRLTANPTKSCARAGQPETRGKVFAHSTVEYQEKWLLDRAEKHGFRLTEDSFAVTASRWLRFAKGGGRGRPVSLLSVTYEGVLQVTDEERFRDLLINGLGRGKAYGLGLMTVMHRR